MAKYQCRSCRLLPRPDRSAKSSVNKSSPRSKKPAGTAARPPKSSASHLLHFIVVSATTISNEEDKPRMNANKRGSFLKIRSALICVRPRLKLLSIDLAAVVFRKGIDELDPARVFVDRDLSFHELLDLVGKRVVAIESFTQHDERLRLH